MTGWGARWLRRRRERVARWLVLRSGKFDSAFYIEEYPDVAASGDDPVAHYCTHGWREARRAGPMVHQACIAGGPIGRRFPAFNPIIVWMLLGRWLGWPIAWPQLRDWAPGSVIQAEIAIIVHETTRTGAPLFALRFARWLRRSGGTEPVFVLLNDGALLPEIWAEFPCLPLFAIPHKDRADFMRTQLGGLRLLYMNSLASLGAWKWLDRHGSSLLLHVHESPASLPSYLDALAPVTGAGPCVIAVNNACRAPLADALGAPPHILPPGIEPFPHPLHASRTRRPLVVGCGTISERKGADLFCHVAAKVSREFGDDVEFMWIGGPGDIDMRLLLDQHGLSRTVTLAGEVADTFPLLAEASVLLLPSRDDPFPLVAIEAAACGVPVVCFDSLADGVGTFISGGAGEVVPAFDLDAMAEAVRRLLVDANWHRAASLAASHAAEQFGIDKIGGKIGKIINEFVGYRLVKNALAAILLPMLGQNLSEAMAAVPLA